MTVCKADLHGQVLGNDCPECHHLVALHSHHDGCGMCAIIDDLREWAEAASEAIIHSRRIEHFGEPPAG